MPDHPPGTDGPSDLRRIARDLRDRGDIDAADRIDAAVDRIDATEAAPAAAATPDAGTVWLTACIDPPADPATTHTVLAQVLTGIDHRVLAVDAATGTVTVIADDTATDGDTAPAGLPVAAGTVTVAGCDHEVVVVTGTGPVPTLADALGALGDRVAPDTDAPVAFRVTYSLDGGRLDDDTILPVLDAASRTLSYFGDLVPVTVVHLADHSVVDYGVLNPGPVSTATIAAGAAGWGGTITVAGVGQVTATLEL